MNSRINKTIFDKEIKTIISDFDETLWSGILAEGEKPKLNKDYYDFLSGLYRKGVVLFGLTKNDESDVDWAFRELKLNKNIFVAVIANWESKAHNIELLFQQLDLRSDTTLFIDDNPLELNDVNVKISGIMTINAKNWKRLKDNPSLKQRISSDKGIKDRYKKYRHALKLFGAKNMFQGTDEAFLYSRKRSIRVGEPKNKTELERVAELFYRTNRLNIFRRPLVSIAEAMEYLIRLKETGYTVYAVSVKDGGEQLGIQAAFSSIKRGDKVLIANGTISCSMISFGDFEKKILNELFKRFFQSVDTIEILVKETSTNYRIREILKSFKFTIKKQREGEYCFTLKKKNFTQQSVPWIRLEKGEEIDYHYYGIPKVKVYFTKYEWKKVKPKSNVVILGIGQGETLGSELTKKFVKHLKTIKASYFPIDIENYENNIVADAEDLQKLFQDETVDYIVCTELLEHTEHYWKVINEMLRILKIGGRIFLSSPYNYPKHEYPIDKWRLSYSYLRKVFAKFCMIEKIQFDGKKSNPRRIIMSLVKLKKFDKLIKQTKGRVDWHAGLTSID